MRRPTAPRTVASLGVGHSQASGHTTARPKKVGASPLPSEFEKLKAEVERLQATVARLEHENSAMLLALVNGDSFQQSLRALVAAEIKASTTQVGCRESDNKPDSELAV